MTWDEHYRIYCEASIARRNAEAYEHLESARKRVAQNTAADWDWLRAALADPVKMWFVAWVFRRQPIPRHLVGAMIRAAVVNADASSIKWLIAPVLETFGRAAVLAELEQLGQQGVGTAARREQALYHLRRETDYARATPPADNDRPDP